MGKLDGKLLKVNIFWHFITLETNVILILSVNCGLKVLLWGPAGRPGAGGIGTKTNSAPNCSWVGVGVWAELGKKIRAKICLFLECFLFMDVG